MALLSYQDPLLTAEQVAEYLGLSVNTLYNMRMRGEGPTAHKWGGAIEAVFRTDLTLKRSGGDPRVLLERLVVELCGGGSGRPRSGLHSG